MPERYETRLRYCGAYATRRRVWWRRRGVVLVGAPEREPTVSERADVRRILAHLVQRGIDARAGPWAGVAAAPG